MLAMARRGLAGRPLCLCDELPLVRRCTQSMRQQIASARQAGLAAAARPPGQSSAGPPAGGDLSLILAILARAVQASSCRRPGVVQRSTAPDLCQTPHQGGAPGRCKHGSGLRCWCCWAWRRCWPSRGRPSRTSPTEPLAWGRPTPLRWAHQQAGLPARPAAAARLTWECAQLLQVANATFDQVLSGGRAAAAEQLQRMRLGACAAVLERGRAASRPAAPKCGWVSACCNGDLPRAAPSTMGGRMQLLQRPSGSLLRRLFSGRLTRRMCSVGQHRAQAAPGGCARPGHGDRGPERQPVLGPQLHAVPAVRQRHQPRDDTSAGLADGGHAGSAVCSRRPAGAPGCRLAPLPVQGSGMRSGHAHAPTPL